MKAHPAEVMVLCASVSPQGIPLTTYQLRYWRGIHSELMTHRVFSRNAGSSRARPSRAIIEQVRHDPWGPLHWGQNQPGMQADEQVQHVEHAKDRWQWAAQQAADAAQGMHDMGLHKQVVNRVLEPYTFIDVVVTATDFANWFALRDHKDADPTIRDLAAQMKDELNGIKRQELQPGEWHLPYIRPEDHRHAYDHLKRGRITRDEPSQTQIMQMLLKMSTARCARISYRAFDGSESPVEKDVELFQKLLISTPLHASPAEHIASPDVLVDNAWQNPQYHANFHGWIQYRRTIPGGIADEKTNSWIRGIL